MSCEPHREYGHDIRRSSPERDARIRLATDVGGALHDMAQPLTILRGSVGVLASRSDIPENDQRYIEMSVRQVERICELLSLMQRRVDAEQSELMRF